MYCDNTENKLNTTYEKIHNNFRVTLSSKRDIYNGNDNRIEKNRFDSFIYQSPLSSCECTFEM